MTLALRLAAALTVAMPFAAPFAAQAQQVSGFYVGAGAGGNFMPSENYGSTTRFGGTTVTYTPLFSFLQNTTFPAYGFSSRGRIPLNPGGAFVASAGYGFGNGLRVEAEANYRVNSYLYSGEMQKFGGMLNVLYDMPFNLASITPYVGLGAGYQWVDRAPAFDRTDSFAYQGIVGAGVPLPWVRGLSATLEYRFMGLAGADHQFRIPGYTVSNAIANVVVQEGTGRRKYNDNFNHSILIGLRYAFNTTPAQAAAPQPVPATETRSNTYLVFFDWDRADLTERARQVVAQAARNVQSAAVTRIDVQGHTDSSGTAGYNQALSLRRASAVAAELVRGGVPRAAIQVQGFGESRPLLPMGDGVREPQNRRVEIVLR